MSKYDKVEELYNSLDFLPDELKRKVMSFHWFHQSYLQGKGDVIFGLRHMDELSSEILRELPQGITESKEARSSEGTDARK